MSVQIALCPALSLSPFPPSHRAMDVRLPAMNLIISSAVLGTLRVSSRGRNKNYPPFFSGLEDPPQKLPLLANPAIHHQPSKRPINPPVTGGCLIRWRACFFWCSHQQIDPPFASWQYAAPTSWTPRSAHRPRPSDNEKLPLTQEAFIGDVPDSPAATRGVTVHEALFTPFRGL